MDEIWMTYEEDYCCYRLLISDVLLFLSYLILHLTPTFDI